MFLKKLTIHCLANESRVQSDFSFLKKQCRTSRKTGSFNWQKTLKIEDINFDSMVSMITSSLTPQCQ